MKRDRYLYERTVSMCMCRLYSEILEIKQWLPFVKITGGDAVVIVVATGGRLLGFSAVLACGSE